MYLYVAHLNCLHLRFCNGDTLPGDLLFCDICGMLSSVERVRWVDVDINGSDGLDAQG